MSAPIRTPRLQDVIDAALQRSFGELYVCRAGKVVSYDAEKQAVDAQPIHRETYFDEDGEEATTGLPVIHRVPVMFPGGGGMRITFPVQPGDDVLLVFSDVGLDKYLSNGGQDIDPVALHQHDLTDAVAIPGLHSFSHAWTGASTSSMTMGRDGGPQIHFTPSSVLLGDGSATESVLKGDTFLAQLATLVTAMSAYAAAIKLIADPSNVGTTTFTTAVTTFLGVLNANLANFKSTIVKVT